MQALPNTGPGPGGSAPLAYDPPLPLLDLDINIDLDMDDPAELDYPAFLDQQQDMGYLASDSASASASTPPSTSPGSATLSEGSSSLPALAARPQQQSSMALMVHGHGQGYGHGGRARESTSPGATTTTTATTSGQKQRLERRGHTKSRRGCFNCKRRRIKCQETRPSCGHCVKQGLKCEYPARPTIVHQPQHQVPLFSLQDMRFFQHFLVKCYPHHPIGAEELWTHEIPCLSQQYEYLMHAMLGYAASDLMSTDASLVTQAMDHRLKAIRAIKRALADIPNNNNGNGGKGNGGNGNGDNTFEEGNALMATCFALTYQSVLLEDGMVEYMTFIRGVVLVAIQMYIKGAKLLFGNYLGDKPKELLEPHMAVLPLINREWAERAVEGIKGLEGLCSGPEREVERQYWERIDNMADKLSVSSWQAYLALTDHYAWWMMLPHQKFQRVIDPTNQVALVLAAHWISLEQIMSIICETERTALAKTPDKGADSKGNPGWLRYLNSQVDAEHRVYNAWPMWVEARLAEDRGFFGKGV